MSGKRALSVSITPGERAQFSFLFDRLGTNDRLNLEEILDRLKGAGGVDLDNLDRLKPSGPVSPDNLSASLLLQFVLDGHHRVRTRQAWEAWAEELASFDKAIQLLQAKGVTHLDAPALGVRPPAFRELLDALSRALHEVSQTACRMVEVLSARAPKRRGAPKRAKADLPLGISEEDTRELLRLVKVAAKNAPLGGPTVTYGMPPPCPECGNPAPRLFRRE